MRAAAGSCESRSRNRPENHAQHIKSPAIAPRTIVLYNDFVKKPINDAGHLATLQNYYAENRVLPSYARLMGLLGFASKSAIKKVLERLEAAGMLDRTADGDWAPTDRFFERAIADLLGGTEAEP